MQVGSKGGPGLDTEGVPRNDIGMTTTKRKLSLSLHDVLVAELETNAEGLSAQVNEAIRHELRDPDRVLARLVGGVSRPSMLRRVNM